MDYLVTMTTRVPDETPQGRIDEVRSREAVRSRELAAAGHLLRLWRPPLRPGEWRSLGLFVAPDGDRLEAVLSSMPLRVWRTDEVMPLSPHPDDPARQQGDIDHPVKRTDSEGAAEEFLTVFSVTVPGGTPEEAVDDTTARETNRASQLADLGYLRRCWTISGEWRTLALWQARDVRVLQAMVESLPLYAWMTVETTPLTQHPSDPAIGEG